MERTVNQFGDILSKDELCLAIAMGVSVTIVQLIVTWILGVNVSNIFAM